MMIWLSTCHNDKKGRLGSPRATQRWGLQGLQGERRPPHHSPLVTPGAEDASPAQPSPGHLYTITTFPDHMVPQSHMLPTPARPWVVPACCSPSMDTRLGPHPSKGCAGLQVRTGIQVSSPGSHPALPLPAAHTTSVPQSLHPTDGQIDGNCSTYQMKLSRRPKEKPNKGHCVGHRLDSEVSG